MLYVPGRLVSAQEPADLCKLLEALGAESTLRAAQRLGGAVLLHEEGLLRLRAYDRFER